MVLWIKWNDDHGIKAVPDNGTVSFSFIYSLISYRHEARSQLTLCTNTVILTSTLDKCLYQAVNSISSYDARTQTDPLQTAY